MATTAAGASASASSGPSQRASPERSTTPADGPLDARRQPQQPALAGAVFADNSDHGRIRRGGVETGQAARQ